MRREIAATFGYAQPEHAIRIAVFAWPSCECVVSIPWEKKSNGEIGRALWAIAYPGGPNDVITSQGGNDRGTSIWSDVEGEPMTPNARGRVAVEFPPSPEQTPERLRFRSQNQRANILLRSGLRNRQGARGEGERWTSRTAEEGSLIIACCDQTVKFFEIWAGKSKGKSVGIGSQAGVLGGSKILEGWCENVGIDEVGTGNEVVR